MGTCSSTNTITQTPRKVLEISPEVVVLAPDTYPKSVSDQISDISVQYVYDDYSDDEEYSAMKSSFNIVYGDRPDPEIDCVICYDLTPFNGIMTPEPSTRLR